MNKYPIFIISILLLSLTLGSCRKNSRFQVDTKKENLKIEIKRFDRDFIHIDKKNVLEDVKALYLKYPDFMPAYVSEVLGENPKDTVRAAQLILKFLSDTAFQNVNKKVLTTFPDAAPYEQSLTSAFSYIHHYFPQLKVPQIYFFVSGFNKSIMFTDQFMAVGTDLYLGSDYAKYRDVTYEYMMTNMRPESITPDIVSAFLFKSFPADFQDDRLLENMLYRGKVMYLLSVVMPDENPQNLMGYTKLQWEWCRKYEKDIWETIVEQKDLFSTDLLLIGKYMNDAPFTSPVSQDSPGRLGTWVGWQIVQHYMDKHKNVSLQDLMKENNYQKILDRAQYNP